MSLRDRNVTKKEEERMNEHIDKGSLTIIVVTFVLFTLALFTKGFTHDLLLEAGVFLVSVKLIVMAYKNSVSNKEIMNELNEIKKILKT
jgi:hypothetical protein